MLFYTLSNCKVASRPAFALGGNERRSLAANWRRSPPAGGSSLPSVEASPSSSSSSSSTSQWGRGAPGSADTATSSPHASHLPGRSSVSASSGPRWRLLGVGIGCWELASGLHRACRMAAVASRRATGRRSSSSGSEACPIPPEECPPPILYQQRWVQLFFLALLALLSDLVCFSVAATPTTWEKVFGQDPALLIDIFLITNVFACFLEPFVIRKFGLRIPIVAAGMLMAVGCALRSGVPFVGDLPGYSTVVAGTMMVAVAQPFFQCTPPLLSATWFAPDERAMATAVAINFNQVGIATAFIIGGAMAGSEAGLKVYFGGIAVAAVVVSIGSLLYFQERPPTPPSASELEKLNAKGESGALMKDGSRAASAPAEEEVQWPQKGWQLLTTPGFAPPLAAFVTSIAVTNVVGAFMDAKLAHAEITDQNDIDLAGAGFELAIVVGGIILGGLVDRNKEYKAVTLVCLAVTFFGVLMLGLDHVPRIAAIIALLAIGAFAGPVQPINAELAVEVTFPADENAIEAVQQLCGNLMSALLVPFCEWAARFSVQLPGNTNLGGDSVILLSLIAGVTAYFTTFSSPLNRTLVDEANCMINKDDMGKELTLVALVADDAAAARKGGAVRHMRQPKEPFSYESGRDYLPLQYII
ncbi:unnamed protein product [Polarella glacialis]|uniref:Major facilitator superfamily (MFS) profile domain-containing protein n=1 Tax=Polarella glacialis TaxID=89957 RepID=A0A813G984_POLGL|nr:unnamed protein product [Polarella glacialis]